jgi:hypothetical protein
MGENKYLKLSFFQDIIFFVINYLLSFPEHAKQIFLHLLHANDDHDNLEIVYPPLKFIQISPQFITDFDQNLPSEPCDNHDQVDEPHETKADISPPVLDPTPSKTQHRYRPLKLPHILHDFPPKHYKYLPVFDGEHDAITAEKHIQEFEHFIDLFEIDHDDVCMRAFSQSLKGDTKEWFKHLQPETISSWEELKSVFSKFWGKKKSLDLQLTEFYALKRKRNETISTFSRRFSSIYYDFPKEIQPTEVAAMLQYATTLHPDLSFLLMERRPKTLQQIFNDAQEIQHNIQACEQIQNEGLDAPGHESEYEQRTVDWNLEHKIDNIIGPLEVLNANDFAKDYIPLIEREGTYVASDPPHDKHGADCFIYSFVDSQEDEFANQLVEEQVDVPSFFLLDDIADVVDFPIYDEYDDDYDVDFLEQPTACSLSENVPFQQCSERNQPTYHSYKEESTETAEGNSLPLCFSSFKLLKENAKIIIEAKECVLMPNHTDSLKQIDKKLQQYSHVFDDLLLVI